MCAAVEFLLSCGAQPSQTCPGVQPAVSKSLMRYIHSDASQRFSKLLAEHSVLEVATLAHKPDMVRLLASHGSANNPSQLTSSVVSAAAVMTQTAAPWRDAAALL